MTAHPRRPGRQHIDKGPPPKPPPVQRRRRIAAVPMHPIWAAAALRGFTISEFAKRVGKDRTTLYALTREPGHPKHIRMSQDMLSRLSRAAELPKEFFKKKLVSVELFYLS